MPLTDRKRATVVAMMKEGTGRNEIARTTGVAPSTLSSVAKKAGLNFDRSQTAEAAAAQATDAKARLRLTAEPTARGF